jgi:APA family basic amino acid/polyamine antiporter
MERKLRKELGLLDVFCVATGAMISSGLFVLPGLAHARAGPAVFLSYWIAALLAVPAMFSKAELVTAMPRAGGDYFYATRSMGDAAGTVAGFVSWFSLSFKSAFALVGMGAYAALVTDVPIKVIAASLCVVFTVVNLVGVRHAGRFQIFLVFGLLTILAVYFFRGLPRITPEKMTPFMPYGFGAVLSTAGFVFISYGGLTKVASIAEEVKNPGKTIPHAMFLSVTVVAILYALVVLVTAGILEPEELDHALTPISDGARVFMGGVGEVALAVAALLAFISTANAGIMSASRYPIAMSRDSLVPPFFQRVNARFGTPHVSILVTGAFMIVAVLVLELDLLVKVASTLLMMLFVTANLSVLIMRESKIQNYQPTFRSPLYPWMQIAGAVAGVALIINLGAVPLQVAALFIGGALVWYGLYAHARADRQSAIVHLVERITDTKLTSYSLETELKGILRERDQIVEDRFDELIKNAVVLDIDEQLTIDDFFHMVSDTMAPRLDTDPSELFELFVEREKESTTALRPGLAIPHVVVDGSGKSDILLARCKGGITFGESLPLVHAVFVLTGTRDERQFHLCALMAIAQIAEEPDFDAKWMRARNVDELKDIVLLGERRRHCGI